MSFTTPAFLAFIAAFALAWPWMRIGAGRRYAGITLASFVFYGWWDWRFLGLLLGTGAVDFAAALLMGRLPRLRRFLLWASVAANLGTLCFFKYLAFGLDQLAAVFDVPIHAREWAHGIVLPVGISFYTFASLSYTIDVYRGELQPVRNPLRFFAFLSMFPHLVAGPIVRASELLPQLETPGHFSARNRWLGLRRIAWGYMKKVIVADHLAPVVNEAFAASPELGLGWWIVVGLFAVQIFCDFSGYCDIACGLAQWMGYRFPENFRQPYAAVGLRDFWSRWHITLSAWFRDYLYIPIGGSRLGVARTNINLLLTMLVSGLWHGANWTFVMWGGFHGLLLALERLAAGASAVLPIPNALRRARVLAGWVLTMACVLVGWALFRAADPGQAGFVIGSMTGVHGVGRVPGAMGMPSVWIALAVIGSGAVHWWLARSSARFRAATLPGWLEATGVAAGLLCAIFLRGPGSDFIYFQF